MRENDFYIFVPSELEFKFAPLVVVTLVKRHVFAKLEAFMALLIREHRRHGTDGKPDGRGATLDVVPREGSIK